MGMETNELTHTIIKAAIKVHRRLGPGLFEKVYKECLAKELTNVNVLVAQEVFLPVLYEDLLLDCGYRLDLLVESKVIIEAKSVDRLLPIHRKQLSTYLKLAKKEVGLLINFNSLFLRDGIIRVVSGYTGLKPGGDDR